MTEKIILSIVSIIMLILTIKKGEKLTTFLTAGLTIGILITWVEVPNIILIGLIIYTIFTLLISLNNLKKGKLTRFNQIVIILTGIWAFVVNLFSIMNWSYAIEIKLSMILPIILYLICLTNGLIKRKELGYLTIINTEFILRLFR